MRSVSWLLEVVLLDSKLCDGVREKEINGFWLVAIVGVIGNRAHLFVGDIRADGWAAERSICIFWSAYLVSAIRLGRLGKIGVW